jgi:hypothetical protein
MATETFFLPGYGVVVDEQDGVVVDEQDGDDVFVPGYGVLSNQEPAQQITPFKTPAILKTKSVPRRPTFGLPRLNRDSPQAEGLRYWVPYSGDSITSPKEIVGDAALTNASGTQVRHIGLNGHDIEFDLTNGGYYTSTLAGSGLSGAAPLTLSAWVGPTTGASDPGIFGFGIAVNTREIYMRTNSTGTFAVVVRGQGTTDSSTIFTSALLTLLTATYDGTSTRLYVNGRLEGGPDAKTVNFSTGDKNVYVGRRISAGNPLKGYGHDFMFWDRCLTESEVFSLYDPATRWDLYEQPQSRIFIDLAPTPFSNPAIITTKKVPERPTFGLPRLNRDSPQAEGLVGWWPLSIGAGSARDFSGQISALGTLTGGAAWSASPLGGGIDFNTAGAFADIGDTGKTVTYPITLIAYVINVGTALNCSRFMNRSTDLLSLISSNASTTNLTYINFDGNGWQWSTGPTIIADGTPSLEVITIYGTNNVDGWVVNLNTGAVDKQSETRTRTKTSASLDDLDLGNDEFLTSARYLRGTLVDVRIVERQYTDAEVQSLYDPATRWDLYAQEPRRSYIDIPAAPGTTIEIPSIGTPP